MDRWVIERIADSKEFGLYNIKQDLKHYLARFGSPELAQRCADLLNTHGDK